MSSSLRLVSMLFCALLVVLLGAGDARAEGAATTTVRKANTTLMELLRRNAAPGSPEEKALAQEVTNKLSTFLDVEELGRRAMKDHWAKLSDEQKKEFTKLLREVVEASYVRALRARLDYDVVYLAETKSDSGVKVGTEVRSVKSGRKQALSIDYILHENGNAWRAFDLVTDGVGLVENYRSQFNKIIAKEGFPGLLARMRKKKIDNA